jgi:NTP pyrophosphatase (non-canonical NTP hydrolase)
MDGKITVGKIRKLGKASREARGWDPDSRSIAISLVLEAGELLEHYQWDGGSGDPEEKEEIEMEVADILYYLTEFADKIDMDISEAFNRKLIKIEEKYPADKIRKLGDKFYFAQKKKYREGK